MEQVVQNAIKGEERVMKNNIFPIKERTMNFFEEKNIFTEMIELLKNNKSISLCLFFKDAKTISEFVSNHKIDIEYLNDDLLEEIPTNNLEAYFNNQDYVNIVLNKYNDYVSFHVSIDKEKHYIDSKDVMIVPIICYFTNNI